MNTSPISEQELHAYADGRLDAARRAEVEAWLHDRPEMRQAVAEWRLQSEHLHRAFDPVLDEAVRASRRLPPLRLAAAVAWLSKRLGAELKPPKLSAQGFELVGGRLLPGEAGPVAQFMYQDARGQRLTLYVQRDAQDSRETAFRYARENGIGVFYWLDGRFGYALSGEMDKPDLLRIATAVYQQLNP